MELLVYRHLCLTVSQKQHHVCWLAVVWSLPNVIHKKCALSHCIRRYFGLGTENCPRPNTVNIFVLIPQFMYFLRYKPFMIGLNWAVGGDWDYSQICMCSHCASKEFDFDCGPCLSAGLCFVHGLLYLGRDKVVCQNAGEDKQAW